MKPQLNLERIEKQKAVFMHNVKWLRINYGLSKRDMAKILRIGVANVSKMENGIFPKRASVEIILRVCDCFDIAPDDLMSKKLDE